MSSLGNRSMRHSPLRNKVWLTISRTPKKVSYEEHKEKKKEHPFKNTEEGSLIVHVWNGAVTGQVVGLNRNHSLRSGTQEHYHWLCRCGKLRILVKGYQIDLGKVSRIFWVGPKCKEKGERVWRQAYRGRKGHMTTQVEAGVTGATDATRHWKWKWLCCGLDGNRLQRDLC